MIIAMQEIKTGLVIVELSPIDAELFIQFQKHYLEFKYLIERRVFDIKSGSATIHFDSVGNMAKNIDFHLTSLPPLDKG